MRHQRLHLDAGVNQPHPLLAPALAIEDVQAVEADWGTSDHDREQHGTGMAGIALYGCLTGLMTATGPSSFGTASSR